MGRHSWEAVGPHVGWSPRPSVESPPPLRSLWTDVRLPMTSGAAVSLFATPAQATGALLAAVPRQRTGEMT